MNWYKTVTAAQMSHQEFQRKLKNWGIRIEPKGKNKIMLLHPDDLIKKNLYHIPHRNGIIHDGSI